MKLIKPSLFGLQNSNRDFGKADAWGKNQFNSSFPAALSCYLYSRGIEANYLGIASEKLTISTLAIDALFGAKPDGADTYFAFEAQHSPFQKYVIGTLPRTDLVIQNKETGLCLRGLEVKLTALPDNTTCDFSDDRYGTEIVTRPDTIAYLAASIAHDSYDSLSPVFNNYKINISDWTDALEVQKNLPAIVSCIAALSIAIAKNQSPFLLQPIWKTVGKSPKFAEHCLDVFAWSNAAFAWFISQISRVDTSANRITRQSRTSIWLYKMLADIVRQEKFDHAQIIDQLSYNTKNDKAFASAGNVTSAYMACANLTKPRIRKDEIKNIILGGGQTLLSPERRLDAIIVNSPELFK